MMLDAVFLAGLFCGLVAALRGNRTAWALLASVAFTSGITLAGVPFHPVLWVLIDLAVVMLVVHPRMTSCDVIVIALFIPAWGLYLDDGWLAYYGASLIVTAQFLLTWPLPQLTGWCRSAFRKGEPPGMRMMAHA